MTIELSQGLNLGGIFWPFFDLLKLLPFYIAVVRCDIMHDVSTLHGMCSLLPKSGNLL